MAPSFGCQIEPYYTAFGNAQKKFREMGYQLQLGPNCYAGEGIGISNTPEKCGQELTDYYCSPENDCLISCGGGELMCETMSHVDFERLQAAEPKWYLGYSDNTNMTYLLATICDTASVYGPCAAAFGMEPWHASLKDAFGILTGETKEVHGYDKWEKESLKNEEQPLLPYNTTESRVLKKYLGRQTAEEEPEIRFSGRLLGGCMDCLVNLLGTRFDKTQDFLEKYKEDGIIWFLEACDLNVFAIPQSHVADGGSRMVSVCQRFSHRKTVVFRTGDDGTGSVPGSSGRGGREECSCDHGCGSGTSGTHDADVTGRLCGSTGTGQ